MFQTILPSGDLHFALTLCIYLIPLSSCNKEISLSQDGASYMLWSLQLHMIIMIVSGSLMTSLRKGPALMAMWSREFSDRVITLKFSDLFRMQQVFKGE